MESWFNADKEAYLTALGPREVIEALSLDDVVEFLKSLGVEDNLITVERDRGILILPTICHNSIDEIEEASHKLYFYSANKMFYCYTSCGSLSIYELYQRYMELNQQPVSKDTAIEYVKQFVSKAPVRVYLTVDENSVAAAAIDLSKYKYTCRTPVLREFPIQVLDYFIPYDHPLWLQEGLTHEVLRKFQVRFWLGKNKIVLPHFDINGRLIGIRGRAISEEDIALEGKYHPLYVGNTSYAFQTGFNLYGINRHKQGIKNLRRAIIVEGEKSVMKDEVFYGEEYGTAVAVCGSNFNKFQISLLTDVLGANEIIIAFDKEYNSWDSNAARDYRKKIESMCQKYSSKATFSYIWDIDGLLDEKDSPYDKGKDVFEELYRNRIRVW